MKRFSVVCLFFLACGGSGGGSGGSGGSGGQGGQGGMSGTGGSAGHDAAAIDTLPMTCGNMEGGTCSTGGESCQCCPGAGPTQHCLCATSCQTDADCHDTARPHCEHDPSMPNGPGFCTPDQFGCCWLCG